MAPKFLHAAAGQFAGLEGTSTFNKFANGDYEYLLYVLHKNWKFIIILFIYRFKSANKKKIKRVKIQFWCLFATQKSSTFAQIWTFD